MRFRIFRAAPGSWVVVSIDGGHERVVWVSVPTWREAMDVVDALSRVGGRA